MTQSTLGKPKNKLDHWTIRYADERPFFKVLKQFIDLRKFGRAYDDDVPRHVNSWKNPFPFWFRGRKTRSADKLTHDDWYQHLLGEAPIFVVSSPSNRVHEIAFDIDDVDKDKPCDGFAVAEVIKRVLLPEGAEVFIEPSRHRRGAYLRVLIKRSSPPKEFNRLLRHVCRSLRERFNETFITEFNAKVCGIKGTVWYRFENPKFDSILYAQKGEAYEKGKKTYIGTEFARVIELERYCYVRGLLVTGACFGCYKDAPERYQQYLDWATFKEGKKVVTEQHFRDWLSANPVSRRRRGQSEREERGEGEINSICQMETAPCARSGDQKHDDLDLVPLQSTPDAWKRSTECYKRLCRHLGRPATFEELWTAYHEQKLNTGEDENDRRKVRLQKVVAIYSVTFDEAKSRGGGYGRRADGLLKLVRDRVRPEHLVGVKYKGGVNEIDLAVALYVVEINAFKLHADPAQQYSCPNNAFTGMFRELKTAEHIGRACGREKAVALKTILQNAGLIACLDPRWVPQQLSARGKGVGKKYGLGEHHPRHTEFQFVLRHQSVVKVGVKAATAVLPQDCVW